MRKIKIFFLTLIFTLSFSIISNSKTIPSSFADLAEKLMPSVVNISTTQTVVTRSNPFPNFNFLQVHLSKICLKSLVHLKKDNLQL